MEKRIVEIQDSEGNVYHPHTTDLAVFLESGETLRAWKADTEVVIAGKAAKDNPPVEITLQAASWTGTDTPYSIEVPVAGVVADNNQIIEVWPQDSAGPEEKLAWMSAGIFGGGQASGKLTLQALAEKPEVDIPINVLIRGD